MPGGRRQRPGIAAGEDQLQPAAAAIANREARAGHRRQPVPNRRFDVGLGWSRPAWRQQEGGGRATDFAGGVPIRFRFTDDREEALDTGDILQCQADLRRDLFGGAKRAARRKLDRQLREVSVVRGQEAGRYQGQQRKGDALFYRSA